MWTINDLFQDNVIIPFSEWMKRGARELDRILWWGIIKIIKGAKFDTQSNMLLCGIEVNSKFINIEDVTEKHIKQKLSIIKYSSLKDSDHKYKVKYNSIYGDIPEHEWSKIFTLIRIIPIENRWKDLQYRIIMRFIGTNYLLFKMNKVNSQNCSFCMLAPETIEHLFFECIHVKNVWIYIFDKWRRYNKCTIVPSMKLCVIGLYNHVNEYNLTDWRALNTLILLVKVYIFSCKIKEIELSRVALLNNLVHQCNLYETLNVTVYSTIRNLLEV